ncbi:GTPase IMAP family member 5-like [Pagrus major]|uniref:GTPase IMAP family member 5-like n=1 Tax=Pagrus major TaxID=143350 RepID=UPI003CC85DA0
MKRHRKTVLVQLAQWTHSVPEQRLLSRPVTPEKSNVKLRQQVLSLVAVIVTLAEMLGSGPVLPVLPVLCYSLRPQPGLSTVTSCTYVSTLLTDDLRPWKRRGSFQWLPPNMSELRVVLLGNSWSQRSSVGNFILGETKFNTEGEPDGCQRVSGRLKEKEIFLINTADLLHPNMSEIKLTEHVETCVRLSDPGPHVFLLVLQPEDFTKEHKLRLRRVLNLFSDRSFDHSLVLMSTPREESPGFIVKYMEHPPLKDMIRMCRYRFLWQKTIDLPELLTRLGQIVKENDGDDVSCDVFVDATSTLPADRQSPPKKGPQTGILGAVKSAAPPTGWMGLISASYVSYSQATPQQLNRFEIW